MEVALLRRGRGWHGCEAMAEYRHRFTSGIYRFLEFPPSMLASCGVAVGLKCGHGCLYCSTTAGFRIASRRRPSDEYCVIDPDTPLRVARDIDEVRPDDVVMLSHSTDAWSPEAQRYRIGPATLAVLLEKGRGTVHVLTKNAAVADSFELMARYPKRVRLSLSVTAPAGRQGLISVLSGPM